MSHGHATPITLNEILLAREERVCTQHELLRAHQATLICFTMNIAGAVKTSPLIERAFWEGVRCIDRALEEYPVFEKRTRLKKSGPEAYLAASADAEEIKARLELLEDSHPIGRWFDIDVIAKDGKKLSRKSPRACMLCGGEGHACARSRAHSVEELTAHTTRVLTAFFLDSDAKYLARLAANCLVQEAHTAPKPGLVTPYSRGSHTDMDVSHFERSARALEPYFAQCVGDAARHRNEGYEAVFARLQTLGREAERTMYAATGGVNTHKGAIFSFGVLLGAIGLLWQAERKPTVDEILRSSAALSQKSLCAQLNAVTAQTAGERAFLSLGKRGVRGEAMDGFPSVRELALPFYKATLAQGHSENMAGVLTLLHLIAHVFDTNLFHRGGAEGVGWAQERVRSLLCNPTPTQDDLNRLCEDFEAKNLSPGGCADLLAVTYFLAAIENEAA